MGYKSSRIIILRIVEQMHYPPSFALSSSEQEKLLDSIDETNEDIRKDMKKEMKEARSVRITTLNLKLR